MSKTTAVIVSAHGKFSEGIMSTVKMIAGEFENVKNVNFLEDDNYEILDKKLEEAKNSLEGYDYYVFITDLMGGTPFNRAVMNYGDNDNVRVLSGLNFASLFTAITGSNDDLDAFVEEILSAGIESIQKYEMPNNDSDEDLFEDGI